MSPSARRARCSRTPPPRPRGRRARRRWRRPRRARAAGRRRAAGQPGGRRPRGDGAGAARAARAHGGQRDGERRGNGRTTTSATSSAGPASPSMSSDDAVGQLAGPARGAGRRRRQPVEALVDELAAAFDEPVGVEHDRRARRDRRRCPRRRTGGRRTASTVPAPPCRCRPERRPGPDEQHRQVPGAGPAQLAGRASRACRHTHVLPCAPGMRAANRSSRSSAAAGPCPSSRYAASALRSWPMTAAARGPVPDDVADGERDAVVVDRDEVVPVAARLGVGVAREVPGRRGQPGQQRQLAGEQAALQDVGHLVLDGVQPGPVQRLRALARDCADGAPARPIGGPSGNASPIAPIARPPAAAGPRRLPGDSGRPHRLPGADGPGQRVLVGDPHPARRPARRAPRAGPPAPRRRRPGRAQRQRVPGDHGATSSGGRPGQCGHDVRTPPRCGGRATRRRAAPRVAGPARTGRRGSRRSRAPRGRARGTP